MANEMEAGMLMTGLGFIESEDRQEWRYKDDPNLRVSARLPLLLEREVIAPVMDAIIGTHVSARDGFGIHEVLVGAVANIVSQAVPALTHGVGNRPVEAARRVLEFWHLVEVDLRRIRPIRSNKEVSHETALEMAERLRKGEQEG